MVDQIDQLNRNFVDEIKDKDHPDREFFNILESIIRLNYRDENFNVDELSRLCRICKSHLREQIKRKTMTQRRRQNLKKEYVNSVCI